MELTLVIDPHSLEEIIEAHSFKDTLTNNYLLSKQYSNYIEEKKLWYSIKDANLYLFVGKEGFYRLYYHVNNSEVEHDFTNIEIVLEIIYRGESKKPIDHVNYWKKNGFKTHLTRDCYFLKKSEVTSKFENKEEFKIESVSSEEDIIFAKKLIDENLDIYTGDRLALHEIEHYSELGHLYCVYNKGIRCGILQAEFKNNIFWLGHIVVDENFRGLGLANELVNHYINEGIDLQAMQFQLWVINDNIPAVNLYQKKGFKYLNKSTLSMLKLN